MVARRVDLIALLSATLLLASHCCAQSSRASDSLQKESETYPLAGKVVNSVTGKPIPRVLVRLPDLQRAVLTDSGGNFSFQNVPAGKVAVSVAKPGYFRADQPLLPDKFYTRNNLPYEFQVGAQTAKLALKLLPEAVIVGTVRGDTGEPLAGVFVNALMPEQGKQPGPLRPVRENVATDADGKYFLSGLAPGRYYLRVSPGQASQRILQPKTAPTQETYPTEVYFPGADAAGAAPLDLAAGEVREANFNLKLIRVDKANSSSPARREPEPAAPRKSGPYQISGVLVDKLSGRPIPRGRVGISDAGDRYGCSAAVVTDGDGRFSFSGLAEGKYILAGHSGDLEGDAYDSHDFPFTTAIVVGPGRDPPSLVFRLPQYSRLSGRITDEAGEPVHKARVLLYWSGVKYGWKRLDLWYQALTDEQGAYHFDIVMPGQYFIGVMASPWYAQRPAAPQRALTSCNSFFLQSRQTLETYREDQGPSPLDVAYPVTFYPGTTEASAASLITLRSGEHFMADLTLKPVPAVHVLLSTSETGDQEEAAKLDSAEIQARLLNGPAVDVPGETRILSSGEIDITGIAPGHYQVKVHALQKNYIMPTESGEMDVSSSGETMLAHEAPSVPLTVNVQFEGTSDPSSHAANQSLSLSDFAARKLYFILVPEAGTFELQGLIEPGNYQLDMFSNHPNFIKAISATGASVIRNAIKIDGSSPVNLNVTVAFDPGTITGVALRDGKPFAGAMILLAPSVPVDPIINKYLFHQDQSDSEGSFILGPIAPGKYMLMAIENGWDLEWTNLAALQPYLARAVVLQVEENGKYTVNVGVQ